MEVVLLVTFVTMLMLCGLVYLLVLLLKIWCGPECP